MNDIGIIIPEMEIPVSLGGGMGEVLSFTMPPQYHILQYKKPFLYGGIIFWLEEVPLRAESCASLHIEGRRRVREVKMGIPFYIRRGGFAILSRNIGLTTAHIVRQVAIF